MQNDSPLGKLLIFWDYDTQWGADRSRLPGNQKRWGEQEFENTEKLLEIHAEFHIPACFAAVGAAALPGKHPYHDPDQIRRIHELGHEVASHTMYHDWLPGLGYSKLLRTLRDSKDALEQCIGDEVISFVPPYNQPYDFPKKFSFSLSERKEAGNGRIDLKRLCDALSETGYLFSRVSYKTIFERILSIISRKSHFHPSKIEKIGDVTCIRPTTHAGFSQEALELLDRCVKEGGYAVAHGHPHAIHTSNDQDEQHLIPFLRLASNLVSSNHLQVVLPRQVI